MQYSVGVRIKLIVISMLLTALTRGALAQDRPNILLIVSDDHRADVLGCAGHPVVRTPHIDRLAADGVRFSNAFVTTSICAASRATILTGLVESTHGFTFGTAPLSADACGASYPAVLRGAGYRTGFVGKFGVSVEGGRQTRAAMFDWFEPLSRSPYVKTLEDGTTRHVTDITGDRALAFLRDLPTGTPFCLSVSFNAAHAEDGDLDQHYPYPASEADLYEGVAMPLPRLGEDVFEAQPPFLKASINRQRFHWRWDTPEKYDRNMRNYLRMLTGMDRNVGRMLAELGRLGLTETTVVIFIGDNGYYMGERGFAGKWSHYEQSLRVPLVICDPRAQPAAPVVEAMTLNLDIAPTILDLAGIVDDSGMQGRSLTPWLDGAEVVSWREGFLCEHLMRHDAIPRWQGYRTGRFKYARYLDVTVGGEFLHDLATDPDELVNLVDSPEHQGVLADLRAASQAAIEEAEERR